MVSAGEGGMGESGGRYFTTENGEHGVFHTTDDPPSHEARRGRPASPTAAEFHPRQSGSVLADA